MNWLELLKHTSWATPGMIVLASFLGSWHCALMCGPLVAPIKDASQMASYHLTRLLSYCSMGALLGLVGLKAERWLNAGFWVSVAMGGVLIFMGLNWMGVWRFPQRVIGIPIPQITLSPVLLGLGTGFLPCGWLWSAYLGALWSRDPFWGAILLGLFHVGSIPSLSVLRWAVHRPLRRLEVSGHRLAGLLLIVAGCFALTEHLQFTPTLSSTPGAVELNCLPLGITE